VQCVCGVADLRCLNLFLLSDAVALVVLPGIKWCVCQIIISSILLYLFIVLLLCSSFPSSSSSCCQVKFAFLSIGASLSFSIVTYNFLLPLTRGWLTSSDSAAVATERVLAALARIEVGLLLGGRTLLSAAHLALVEGVASSEGVLLNGNLALLEEGAPHGLLGLLAGGGRVDHLLRLEQNVVHPAVLALDRSTSAHPVHVVRVHRHFIRVDELVASLLVGDGSDARTSVRGGRHRNELGSVGALGAIRVLTHSHLLGSCRVVRQLGLDLSSSRFAL